MTRSALYDGAVVHQRTAPVKHRLRYTLFMALLDLDELPALSRRLWLFSHDRFNLFAFDEADHGAGARGGLRGWIESQLRAAGIAAEGGRIAVLCMPRVLGHVFNPISVFFCHRPDGGLAAMLYEVNNTFGERHAYLLPVTGEARPIRQSCEKCFYVSPFMPMALTYRFRVSEPEAHVSVAINASNAQGPMISTVFAGTRTALTDCALLRLFMRMPLLGLKVLAGIHFEAARLFFGRGLKIQPKPAPPAAPVSITL